MNTTVADSNQNPRLFTFKSGGWVLLLTAMFSAALLVWALAPALMRSIHRQPGDGQNVASYQFDLSELQVPLEEIIPIMIHRDMAPAMFDPSHSKPVDIAAADSGDLRWKSMQQRNDPKYGKYLVPNDRVIGVTIDGESRCYPISVMNVHEIINDTLGGTPIAVTYHWPADASMVFDRRVIDRSGAQQTVEFAVSGLLYNCNLLMYNVRRDPSSGELATGGESLFSQVKARGVSGAFAGSELRQVSCDVTSWEQWSARYPMTTVLDRDISMAKRYKDAAPTQYFQSDEPLRPVHPGIPSGLAAKTPVLAIKCGEQRLVFPVTVVQQFADHTGAWRTSAGACELHFRLDRNTKTVVVSSPTHTLTVAYAFWFVWHAMHPDDLLIVPRA